MLSAFLTYTSLAMSTLRLYILGETALHHATRKRIFKLVKVLLEQRHATVQTSNSMSNPPLDTTRDNLKVLLKKKDPPNRSIQGGEGKARACQGDPVSGVPQSENQNVIAQRNQMRDSQLALSSENPMQHRESEALRTGNLKSCKVRSRAGTKGAVLKETRNFALGEEN